MPRKGEKRPPNVGRKKGTPNKVSRDLRALMEEEVGCPVPLAMLRLSKRYMRQGEENVQPELISTGARLMAQACDYAYPKLKAIEHSGKIDAVQYVAHLPPEAPSIEAWAAKVGTTPQE